MPLNHFQGPVLSKNYMGFATKTFEVCGPRRTRRRRDTTSMLMAAGVAIAAVIGVSLGLREAGGATEPAGLQVAMPPAFSTELEPRLSEAVIQAGHRGVHARESLEDVSEAGERQQFDHPRGRAGQLEVAADAADGDVRGNQFAEPRAVDVVDARQVEQHVPRAAPEHIGHGFLQHAGIVVDRETAVERDDADVAVEAAMNLHAPIIPKPHAS